MCFRVTPLSSVTKKKSSRMMHTTRSTLYRASSVFLVRRLCRMTTLPSSASTFRRSLSEILKFTPLNSKSSAPIFTETGSM